MIQNYKHKIYSDGSSFAVLHQLLLFLENKIICNNSYRHLLNQHVLRPLLNMIERNHPKDDHIHVSDIYISSRAYAVLLAKSNIHFLGHRDTFWQILVALYHHLQCCDTDMVYYTQNIPVLSQIYQIIIDRFNECQAWDITGAFKLFAVLCEYDKSNEYEKVIDHVLKLVSNDDIPLYFDIVCVDNILQLMAKEKV